MKNRMIKWVIGLYLLGVFLDVASTLLCRDAFSDWSLSSDFNPMVRDNASVGLLAYSAIMAFVMTSAFAYGWPRRHSCHPAAPSGWGDFCLAFLTARNSHSRRAGGGWLSTHYLSLLAILAPMVLGMGHYRVAVTNTLQALGLFEWPSLEVFLAVRGVEMIVYLLITLRILFLDYRRELGEE